MKRSLHCRRASFELFPLDQFSYHLLPFVSCLSTHSIFPSSRAYAVPVCLSGGHPRRGRGCSGTARRWGFGHFIRRWLAPPRRIRMHLSALINPSAGRWTRNSGKTSRNVKIRPPYAPFCVMPEVHGVPWLRVAASAGPVVVRPLAPPGVDWRQGALIDSPTRDSTGRT